MEFINKNPGEILALVVIVVGWCVSVGVTKAKFTNLQEIVTKLETLGSSYTRESIIGLKSRLETMERKVEVIETKKDEMMDTLNEIKTTVEVIKAWIQTQNGK